MYHEAKEALASGILSYIRNTGMRLHNFAKDIYLMKAYAVFQAFSG